MPYPHALFEVTCRCLQRRFLLRPSEELNDLILGIVGRAQTLYPVRIYLFVVVSNHMHLLVSAPDNQALARFMEYINGNIAREAGALHGWQGKFWARRYSAVPILDDRSMIRRAYYLLSHGCKEGLVGHPRDWPGVHCVSALCEGAPLIGHWIDRTGIHREEMLRREDVDDRAYRTAYDVKLSALPCWADKTEEERQVLFREMVEAISCQTRERLTSEGARPLGVRRVLRRDPHGAPDRPNRSPAPICHAVGKEARKAYRKRKRDFVLWYRRAAGLLKGKPPAVSFPDNCFRPPLAYNPWRESEGFA